MPQSGAKVQTRAMSLDERQVEEIVSRICKTMFDKISEKLQSMEQKLDGLVASVQKIQSEVEANHKSVSELEDRIAILEDSGRKNTLRLDGIAETPQENLIKVTLTLINDKLGIKCTEDDLNDVYRLGRPNSSKPRTVIVKFISFLKKFAIYKSKSLLKNTGIYINEDLGKPKYEAFKSTRIRYGAKNVWTINGRIYFKNNRNISILR
nr:unnamed protein product [Callosobruchus analis]